MNRLWKTIKSYYLSICRNFGADSGNWPVRSTETRRCGCGWSRYLEKKSRSGWRQTLGFLVPGLFWLEWHSAVRVSSIVSEIDKKALVEQAVLRCQRIWNASVSVAPTSCWRSWRFEISQPTRFVYIAGESDTLRSTRFWKEFAILLLLLAKTAQL